ncbi:hypothetical protein CR513_31492, partial [Mucuna pruriens]
MTNATSGGALIDKMPATTRHLISNMASNTQQIGIRGAGHPGCLNAYESLVRLLDARSTFGRTQRLWMLGLDDKHILCMKPSKGPMKALDDLRLLVSTLPNAQGSPRTKKNTQALDKNNKEERKKMVK